MSIPAIKHRRAIANRLMKWFDGRERDLPWIDDGTPYHIWVSEIMLQQTQIATVIDYYKRFIKKFPNVKKLAAADLDDVLKMWEGLGYYRRARQLHAAAKVITDQHNGNFPTRFDDVRALPGIGRYTAAAILSIATDQPLAILEGNTIRLFARLTALKEDTTKSSSQQGLWEFSERLLPQKRPGDFNQALMDLGREICKPKEPRCDDCLVSDYCLTYVHRLQDQIPVRGRKMIYEDLHEAIVLIERKGKFLMRKCQPGERWAGLWDFPRAAIESQNVTDQIRQSVCEQTGLQTEIQSLDKTIKHAVTKYRIRLDCYQSVLTTGRLHSKSHFKWKTTLEIDSLPLSTTGRKFAKLFC